MWDQIINIRLSELLHSFLKKWKEGKLLHTKIKESKVNEHKKIKKKMDNILFLPNNIFKRLFKELKNIIMTINNI